MLTMSKAEVMFQISKHIFLIDGTKSTMLIQQNIFTEIKPSQSIKLLTESNCVLTIVCVQ